MVPSHFQEDGNTDGLLFFRHSSPALGMTMSGVNKLRRFFIYIQNDEGEEFRKTGMTMVYRFSFPLVGVW